MGVTIVRPLTREGLSSLPALVSDGAWGTELQKLGAQPGQLADLWNVEHPERVLSVARAYVDAGAEVILTNTFNSNRVTLTRHGLESRVAELNRAGAELSRQAAGQRAYVFASIGPTGKLVSMGELAAEEAEDIFADQAAALAAGGADAIVIETQSDAAEAEAALRGCRRACTLPVGVSFTFDSGPEGRHTMMGVSVESASALALRCGADFVGANCGAGIESFVALAAAFVACSGLPIWIKGNAGKPQLDAASGRAVYPAGPADYAVVAPALLAAGARFVGGCCGSSPTHIQALAAAVARLSR